MDISPKTSFSAPQCRTKLIFLILNAKKKKLHASEPHKANTTTHLPAIKILRPPFYNNVFDVMSGDAMIIPYRALLI